MEIIKQIPWCRRFETDFWRNPEIAQLGEHMDKFYIWTRLLIENPDGCTVKIKA